MVAPTGTQPKVKEVPKTLEGLGLCTNCVQGIALPGELPKGKIEQISSLNAYVARSFKVSNPNKAILYFYDICGLALANNKLIPNRLAEAHGVTVFVPDLLGGGLDESIAASMP